MVLKQTTAELGVGVQIKGSNAKKRAPNEIRSPFVVLTELKRSDPVCGGVRGFDPIIPAYLVGILKSQLTAEAQSVSHVIVLDKAELGPRG